MCLSITCFAFSVEDGTCVRIGMCLSTSHFTGPSAAIFCRYLMHSRIMQLIVPDLGLKRRVRLCSPSSLSDLFRTSP